MTTSSSPELSSEPNSSAQTEGESSDESNENEQSSDDEQSEQKSDDENVKAEEEQEDEQRSLNASVDEVIADEIEKCEQIENVIEATTEEKTEETNDEIQENEQESLDDTKSISGITTSEHETSLLSEDDLDDIRYKNLKLFYGGRNILDLGANLTQSCNVQYTHLPDFNFPMYLANRSQYHRLGAGWDSHDIKCTLCRRCGFRFPTQDEQLSGATTPATAAATAATKTTEPIAHMCNTVNHLAPPTAANNLMQNLTISSALNRISPINVMNPPTSKFSASSTPLPTSGQMYNFNNLMNNNASNNQQSFAYQNQMAATAASNNNMYKQQHQHQQPQNAGANPFYGNNMTLNSMISQMAIEANSTFNPNQQQQFGGGNGTNYAPNMNQMNATALLNQLMNQNRQNQGGMCRPLANKSGINLNGNSHNKMPAYKMYSHF